MENIRAFDFFGKVDENNITIAPRLHEVVIQNHLYEIDFNMYNEIYNAIQNYNKRDITNDDNCYDLLQLAIMKWVLNTPCSNKIYVANALLDIIVNTPSHEILAYLIFDFQHTKKVG